jgi:hypothetical protein
MYRNAGYLIATALTLGVAAGHTPPAVAAAAAGLAGTYVIDRHASDDPRKAVEEALPSRRRRLRGGSNKLGDAMEPPDTIRIATHGDTIALTTSGRLHLTTVPGAGDQSYEGGHGKSAESASAWEAGTLVVRMRSEQFDREARYALDSGGSLLRIATTMTAPRLSQPIRYTLVYHRVSAS